MTEKWIISGGCGFIGSNLAAALIDDGMEVVALDTLVRAGSIANLEWLKKRAAYTGAGRFIHLPADMRSQTDIDAVFEKHGKNVNAVAHLAGQVAMTTSLERPRYDFEVNVLGAINILEAVKKHSPQSIVMFSSTNKIYGNLEHIRHVELETRWTQPDFPQGLDESTPLNFHSPYGCSKGAADQYFLDYHRMFGLKTMVFRHSSIYGGRQYATYNQGWVGWFCQQVLLQKQQYHSGLAIEPFTISGDGKQVRDLLYAEDIVKNYRLAYAASTQSDICIGQAFNIGGGMENSLSLLELFSELERLTGITPKFTSLPARASDQKVFVANNNKAKQCYGWTPQISTKIGIANMLNWYHRGFRENEPKATDD